MAALDLFLAGLDRIDMPESSREQIHALLRSFQCERLWISKTSLSTIDADIDRWRQSGYTRAEIVKRLKALHGIGRTAAYAHINRLISVKIE